MQHSKRDRIHRPKFRMHKPKSPVRLTVCSETSAILFFFFSNRYYSHKQGTLVSTFSNAIRHQHLLRPPPALLVLPVSPIQIAVRAGWRGLFHLVEFVFGSYLVQSLAVGLAPLSSSSSAPLRRNEMKENVTFPLLYIFNIALPVAMSGSLAGTLQAQRRRLMETNWMIVEKNRNNPLQGFGC